MRLKIMTAAFLLAGLAYAKEPKPHNSGTLLQMDSVQCGTAEKSARSFAGEVLGTDSGHKNTQQVLCQEYVLQTDRVVYRIRPRDEKHPALLPVRTKRPVLHGEGQDAASSGGSGRQGTRLHRGFNDPS